MEAKKNKKIGKIVFIILAVITLLILGKTTKAEVFQPIGIGTNGNRNYTNAKLKTNTGSEKSIWQFTYPNTTEVTNNIFCANEGGAFYGRQAYNENNLYDFGKRDLYVVVRNNYSKILWILDNVYVSKDITEKNTAESESDPSRIEAINAMIRNLKEVTGHKVDSQIDSIYNSGDRDELFYEIAQCLVWSYTSNVGNGNNPLQISQIIYKSNVKSDVYAVYSALKEQADKQTNYTSPNLNANKIKNYIN